jgi:hypothetical protein
MASDPTRDDLIASAIASLRATVALATPAPWEVGLQDEENPSHGPCVRSPQHPTTKSGEPSPGEDCIGFQALVTNCYDYHRHETNANYALIVALRNLAPQMLDVLEAAQAVAAADADCTWFTKEEERLRDALTAFAAAAAKHGGRT